MSSERVEVTMMNRQRRYKLPLLMMMLLLLVTIMSACDRAEVESGLEQASNIGSQDQLDPIGEGTDDLVRIGFSMGTLREERWRKDRDMFVAAAESRGAEVLVSNSNEDGALQIRQVETMISEGIDILVIVPHDAETAATVVKKAHDAGIQVIAYDRLVNNSELDLYISFDNERVGELQAEAITSLVPQGNYVYIGGAKTDYNSHLFKKGAFRILQPYIERGDIKVVFDNWSVDWSPEAARLNMIEAIEANHGQIDAVIAANDGTAGGAIEALEMYGLAGKIPVAGMDADLPAIQRIIEGKQTMTVYKPIGALSNIAAEVAVRMARGESVEAERFMNNGRVEVPSILLVPIVVDKTKVEDTVITDGFHTREAIYQNDDSTD